MADRYREDEWMRQRQPLLGGLLVALAVFAFAEGLIRLELAREQDAARLRLQNEASTVRAALESDLNSTLFIGLSAAALVSAKPDFRKQDYERLAQSLYDLRPSVRNIVLVPDNVVRYVYPLKGNESVIGVDLTGLPEQRETVVRAQQEGHSVLAGPLQLLQGGLGLVNRVPIMVADARGQQRYWGLAEVVVDALPIFEKAGVTSSADISYALRGRDGKGAAGDIFFGPPEVFGDSSALRLDVVVPGGKWQLAARWRDEDAARLWSPVPWHFFAWLMALLVGGLAAYALSGQHRLHQLATHDSLTGLANRHQFLIQAEGLIALAVRQKSACTLINLDLEDFKLINDEFGHETGDAMLVYVAQQARACLRGSDLIARFGGDEFLVLLPDAAPGPLLDQMLERLRVAISRPLLLKGRLLSVNASAGVASYPRDGSTLSELMRAADINMYADKRARRDEPASVGQGMG